MIFGPAGPRVDGAPQTGRELWGQAGGEAV